MTVVQRAFYAGHKISLQTAVPEVFHLLGLSHYTCGLYNPKARAVSPWLCAECIAKSRANGLSHEQGRVPLLLAALHRHTHCSLKCRPRSGDCLPTDGKRRVSRDAIPPWPFVDVFRFRFHLLFMSNGLTSSRKGPEGARVVCARVISTTSAERVDMRFELFGYDRRRSIPSPTTNTI